MRVGCLVNQNRIFVGWLDMLCDSGVCVIRDGAEHEADAKIFLAMALVGIASVVVSAIANDSLPKPEWDKFVRAYLGNILAFCDVIVARMRQLWPDLPVKRNGKKVK